MDDDLEISTIISTKSSVDRSLAFIDAMDNIVGKVTITIRIGYCTTMAEGAVMISIDRDDHLFTATELDLLVSTLKETLDETPGGDESVERLLASMEAALKDANERTLMGSRGAAQLQTIH